LKLVGVQVVELGGAAGVDRGDLGETEVAALFGQTPGFKASAVTETTSDVVEDVIEDDDF
jgi:hypothetical protein